MSAKFWVEKVVHYIWCLYIPFGILSALPTAYSNDKCGFFGMLWIQSKMMELSLLVISNFRLLLGCSTMINYRFFCQSVVPSQKNQTSWIRRLGISIVNEQKFKEIPTDGPKVLMTLQFIQTFAKYFSLKKVKFYK